MKPSENIDKLIADTADWRGKMLADVRKAILAADPGVVEEWKWRGSPVWECDGIIAVGGPYKDKVKFTFSNGAHLEDPDKLFNNGLDGNKWRSIDIHEGVKIDKRTITNLVREAIAYNRDQIEKKATAAKGKKK